VQTSTSLLQCLVCLEMASENRTDSAPVGYYLASEAGQLAGVSGQTIGQWKRRGYIEASMSDEAFPYEYSYQDVAEAMVVHDLLDHRVPLRSVKGLIQQLREHYGHRWPLQRADLLVPVEPGEGSLPVIVAEGEHRFDVTARPMRWHEVIDGGNLQRIADQLSRGGWAARLLPNLRHVEVDPRKMSGRPSIRGLRIAAEDVAVMASEVGGDFVRSEYGLSRAQVKDATDWWSTVVQLSRAA
jgi:uncharacterized protein (DUF433 family)/DNA-binding transcriptional MerR regulator